MERKRCIFVRNYPDFPYLTNARLYGGPNTLDFVNVGKLKVSAVEERIKNLILANFKVKFRQKDHTIHIISALHLLV